MQIKGSPYSKYCWRIKGEKIAILGGWTSEAHFALNSDCWDARTGFDHWTRKAGFGGGGAVLFDKGRMEAWHTQSSSACNSALLTV